jgi:hypothetical protein
VRRLLVALVVAVAAPAAAQVPIGVGLYAPTVPFAGPVARLDFISALAAQLGAGYAGHAYARAADFTAAVRRGELAFAVVDAVYLAAIGSPYRILAVAGHAGASEAAWEVVAAPAATKLLDLRGRSVVVPAIGARDDAFLTQVLLEGELGKEFFAKVAFAPDALSALAAVERGRADCAIVPSGGPLPAGLHHVATLRALSWPVLVALPGASGAAEVAAAASAARLPGQALDRFSPGGEGAVQALAAQLARGPHRAPFLAPPLRVAGAGLVGAAGDHIVRARATSYLMAP